MIPSLRFLLLVFSLDLGLKPPNKQVLFFPPPHPLNLCRPFDCRFDLAEIMIMTLTTRGPMDPLAAGNGSETNDGVPEAPSVCAASLQLHPLPMEILTIIISAHFLFHFIPPS